MWFTYKQPPYVCPHELILSTQIDWVQVAEVCEKLVIVDEVMVGHGGLLNVGQAVPPVH